MWLVVEGVITLLLPFVRAYTYINQQRQSQSLIMRIFSTG